MKLSALSYEYSKDFGFFAIEFTKDGEEKLADLIEQKFNDNQYITPESSDDSFVSFIFNKDGLDISMIREIWKKIKKELN